MPTVHFEQLFELGPLRIEILVELVALAGIHDFVARVGAFFDLDHLGLGIHNQRVPKVGDGPELRLERENRLSIRRLPLIRLLEARLQMRLDRNIERLRQRLRKRVRVDPRLLLRRRQVMQVLDNLPKLPLSLHPLLLTPPLPQRIIMNIQ